jgi:pimeloyl-ACP methyl ester carboxylesterase
VDDLIAAAREIGIRGLASPDSLFLRGSGAGGWLVTSAAALRPELFRGMILDRPVLDLEAAFGRRSASPTARDVAEWGSDSSLLKQLSPSSFTDGRFSVDTLVLDEAEEENPLTAGIFEWMYRARCSGARPPQVTLVPGNTPAGPDDWKGWDEQRALEEAFILTKILP